MARKGNYRRGPYQFTYKRRAALARAQAISARKRKREGPVKKIAKIAGIAGAIGATAYLGYRHRGTIGKTAGNWRNAVQPGNKEATRISSAISVAPPSRTTVITPGARARADAVRQSLQPRAPRNVDPEKRTERQARRLSKTNPKNVTSDNRIVTKKRKRTVSGSKTRDHVPGMKTPSKSTQKVGGFTEDQWQTILGFER